MITRTQAIHLLKEYGDALKALHTKIEISNPHHEIPSILTALTAIAEQKNPDDKTDPQATIENYLISLVGRKTFKNLYELHLKDDLQLCEQLRKFHDEIIQSKEQIVIYRAKNKKLGVTFPDGLWRAEFINALGGYKVFSANHRYYSNQLSPYILDKNPTTLYIHSYQAPNTGEIAAEFPNLTMRTAFMTLLQHNFHGNMNIVPQKSPIYFSRNHLLNYGSNFKVPAPMIFVNQVYNSAKRQIERATVIIKKEIQEWGNASTFFKLPSELRSKIAANATDAVSIPEDERQSIANSYFKPPTK